MDILDAYIKHINSKLKEDILMKQEEQYIEDIPKEFIAGAMIKGQCDGDCKKPAIGNRRTKIWCQPSIESNGDAGSHCVLFRLSKDWGNDPDDFDENPPWERMDGRKHPYEPDEYYYRCWCVK